jgi:hypothetical protein
VQSVKFPGVIDKKCMAGTINKLKFLSRNGLSRVGTSWLPTNPSKKNLFPDERPIDDMDSKVAFY